MATVFTIMSYGGMALAVICFVIAVILFIKWKIPKVFGDITGRTQKKTIQRIRAEGYKAGTVRESPESVVGTSGKIRVRRMDTDTRHTGGTGMASDTGWKDASGREQRETAAAGEEAITDTTLHVCQPEETATTLLRDSSDSGGDTVLLANEIKEGETSVLANGMEEETTVLAAEVKEAVSMASADNFAEGVILLPEETFTQPGTVAKVLDVMVTHTEDNIA